ncbi:FAD-dependent oxidoreductase [Mucilaginibacter gynuensis]|uniref:FAD-dependent oxidoreductase n=1 Tax=Mucilaginibacter gynuensis TaxID=1302236 RepID=A0ABP8G689_9SPHI
MQKPIIFSVDDDIQVLRTLAKDLRSKYGKAYKIISMASAKESLRDLADLKRSGAKVALLLSDQRMPEMEGVSFLRQAMKIFPDAKKVLLTAYSDTNAAIDAINDIKLDHYLLKPWDPPEQRLYPVLTDLLEDWQRAFIPDFRGIKIIGYQYSPHSHEIKDYLAGNLVPYRWLDIETNNEAHTFLEENLLSQSMLPVIIYEDGSFQSRPSIQGIASKTGRSAQLSYELYDVIIIGAGPAGLAAAVYGASEGLKTVLVERKAPGGQAGTSSRIENYLGFPAGLSGADLTQRAITQATRLGAEFISPCRVVDIRLKDEYKIVVLEDKKEIITRAIVITTGVDYRRLEAPGIDRFTGAGVYYGSAMTEAYACRGKNVVVLGGGNSGGQSAVYLSNFARSVYIVVRRNSLVETMSAYLIEQIDNIKNIYLITESEIESVKGTEHLQEVTIRNISTGSTKCLPAAALYIFIGAKPYTDWIQANVARNDKGYILTGRDLLIERDRTNEKNQRDPYLLETSCRGIFAAGDVRAGAMARVASAVGEGSMAISFVHKYLSEQ